MKKRVLALALAAVMSMGVIASAEDVQEAGGNASKEVSVTTQDYQYPEHTYLVTITIPDLSFTYKKGSLSEWSTSEYKYGKLDEAGWEETEKTIEVTNKSDVDVKATCKFEATGDEGITGTFPSGDNSTVNSAVNKDAPTEPGTPGNASFTLQISGDPKTDLDSTTVGTVTVTITDVEG